MSIDRCFACLDLGFTYDLQRGVRPCWRDVEPIRHNRPTAVALAIRSAAEHLPRPEMLADDSLRLLATLARATAAQPLRLTDILEKHFSYLPPFDGALRFSRWVEWCRRDWGLDVRCCSGLPDGFWISTEN